MERVIFLVDMNAFFISCESTRYPEIIGKPAAVAGDPKNRSGIILTANYEARKYGIKTTMVLRKALKLCPNLIVVPPDHHFYEQKSKEVMNILSSYTPVIEQNSIDEAWLDMTGCEGIFGKPLESATKIMEQIKKELGLWCSIGISENKFLSKMASEMKKPLGITELWNKDINQKMWPLPVQYMYGVGKQTSQKLQNMGIITIGDLAIFDKIHLQKKFGKIGAELFSLANGIDNSPLTPYTESDMKSIGRSVTLPQDITDIEYAKVVLMKLSDEVGMTARKYKKKGHTIQISIKYANFKSMTRQMTIPSTCLVKEIYSTGVKLLQNNWNNEPIRLLGISLSGFYNDNADQISIFKLPEISNDEKSTIDKIDNLENTIHNIRKKYGSSIIKPGVLIKKEDKE
ncbi:DNA polymerase IV [Sedimentibacter sp. MB31-C6]|uniref:DNA polymerase IV n=1 Tax=Sedimentibacter sp. MB31-C6 TaxID=3109366 RepID=UPI002DDC900B|nr:DNA polymerase IV [Sedimentibacter sp. MB36-C1]WSI03698.1 DNA polymerase IV [Sedimentibacter sp. MB36-C1]